jgi:hypothetical protein
MRKWGFMKNRTKGALDTSNGEKRGNRRNRSINRE